MQFNIFRANDIRGEVNSELNEDVAFKIAQALSLYLKKQGINEVIIGRDCRHSSLMLQQALESGLNENGIDCVEVGYATTPQIAWNVNNSSYKFGVEVTGSHNPAKMNGFKFFQKGKIFSKPEIETIKSLVIELEKNSQFFKQDSECQKKGVIKRFENNSLSYIADMSKRISLGAKKLKVVLDAGNGVAGITGYNILKNIGLDVIKIFCEPDGDFPNHHPDPVIKDNLTSLAQKVLAEKADFGIGFDGDGDRIGVIDEKGHYIPTDKLLILYALYVLKENPQSTIIADVKCSNQLFQVVKSSGGKTVMTKTGRTFIEKKVKELNAPLGGELSGHIFFNDRFYGIDDATYCAGRLAEILSKTEKSLSTLIEEISVKCPDYITMPEERFFCSDESKFEVIAELKDKLVTQYQIDVIDGVRVYFDSGWGLIRASNTEPALSLRIEADNEIKLEQYKKILKHYIQQVIQSSTKTS